MYVSEPPATDNLILRRRFNAFCPQQAVTPSETVVATEYSCWSDYGDRELQYSGGADEMKCVLTSHSKTDLGLAKGRPAFFLRFG